MSNLFNITECAICMTDILDSKNFCTTECGHTFHSSCIFNNMMHRVECPMCRTALAEEAEDSDDEDSDEEDSDYESDSEIVAQVTCKQMANKLTNMGYKMEDLICIMLGGNLCNAVKQDTERHTDIFFEKLDKDIEDIIDGTISVDHRDGRTYAQVIAGITPTTPTTPTA